MGYVTLVAGTTITSSWANANVRDQGVTPFADAASRTSAISAPVEGMVSYLRDVNRFDFYNGAAWQPVAGVGAKVVRSGDMSIASGTPTPVEWQTVSYDGFSMWSGTNPERLTAPWAGYYAATATINWASTLNGTYRRTTLYTGGTAEDATTDQITSNADPSRQNVSAVGLKLAAAGFVEIRVTHDAGVTRTIDPTISNFKLAYLGPAV